MMQESRDKKQEARLKNIIFTVMIFITRGLYALLRSILPVRNVVVFLSRQSNTPSVDFLLLQKELKRQAPHLRQKVFCRRMDGDGTAGNASRRTRTYIDKNKQLMPASNVTIKDLLYLIKPTLALLTAKGCFVDGQCIPLSLYKQRKGFVAVQIWHALGALKKFGWQSVDSPDGHSLEDAKRWNMHGHYSFVTCASNATREFYSEGFKTPLDDVLVLGMPRIDDILRIVNSQELRDNIYAAHPVWRQKIKLLYVPTFRKGRPLDIKPMLDVLTPEMREKYKLIIKVHPNDIKPNAPPDIALTSIPTLDLLSVADVIITDYSAFAIESTLSDKPLYFYVPDLEEYRRNTGLNVHLEDEMPGVVFTDFTHLMNDIENGNYYYEQLARFKRKYVATANGGNTQRIVSEFLRRV